MTTKIQMTVHHHLLVLLFALALSPIVTLVNAFVPNNINRVASFVVTPNRQITAPSKNVGVFASQLLLKASSKNKEESASSSPYLTRVPDEDEGVPIPFLDDVGNSFIDCYADSVASVNGVEYTIGVPCDYCVALCYYDDDGNLVPVELQDELMDDVFSVAENIVYEEFGEELTLQRTPQTLTLVGELEEDEEDDDLDDDDEDDELYTGEEEVEVLLSFEHRDKEFNLVRLLDPVLLVGKTDPERPDLRILLTPEESDAVMPSLEEMFLKYHEDRDGAAP